MEKQKFEAMLILLVPQVVHLIIRDDGRAFSLRIVLLIDKPAGDHVQILDSQGVGIDAAHADAAGHLGLTDRTAADIL